MATSGTKAASAAFRESLERLTDEQGALQRVLRQAREMIRAAPGAGPLETELRRAERDLNALQVGSRRVMTQIGQLQGLAYSSAVIASSLEPDRVLEEVMDTAIQLTRAERAYLVLVGDDGELELRAARNWDRETLDEREVAFSRSVIEQALASRAPVLTINAQGDERFRAMESVLANDLRSIVCLPLVLRDRVLGVLYADNHLEQGVFDQDSLELLGAFANHAAVAIQNSRSFQRVRADLDDAKAQVARLQIAIDEQHVARELTEITETDYFQRISDLARDLRHRKAAPGPGEATPVPERRGQRP